MKLALMIHSVARREPNMAVSFAEDGLLGFTSDQEVVAFVKIPRQNN